MVALFEDVNKLLQKSENGVVSSGRKFCEEITSNASDPLSKIAYKKTQDNQQEKGIPNQVGNPCNKLYRDIFQDRLPWDQTNDIQRESEILTRFNCPVILPKGKT